VAGIGLVNVKRRLDLLYPGKYELNIRESPSTYAVHLDLELQPSSMVNMPPRSPLDPSNHGTRVFHP